MLQLTEGQRDVSLLGDVLTAPNILAASEAVVLSLWENIFLKNIGIILDVQISDIIYLRLPHNVFTDLANLSKIAVGLCLLALCRLGRRNAFLVVPLLLLALSYIFILSAGRLTTNTLEYVLTQPRHFYFPNALVIICLGLLLQKSFERTYLRQATAILLVAIAILNAGNVFSANELVARTMRPIDDQYARLQAFLEANPSARVFIDFVPDNRRKLNLGLDIAFDALYQGSNRITKSVKAATHVYDSRGFTVNGMYDPASLGPYLGDFTVQWQFWVDPASPLRRDVAVIGSEKVLPRIIIAPDDLIRVDMVNSVTGKVDQFRFKLPSFDQLSKETPHSGGWPEVIIEKEGDELSFILNGTLKEKVHLDAPYLRWDKDGIGLLGQVYWGAHQMIFATRLFVEMDGARYSAADYNVGDRLNTSVFRPW